MNGYQAFALERRSNPRFRIGSSLTVLASAGVVAWTGSHWPEIAVGVVFSVLGLTSSVVLIRESLLASYQD